MPENENNCTPISISLLVAPKGNDHRFSFGIAKGCTATNEATWAITFKLEEKDDDEWVVVVDFRLDINQEAPGKTEKAKELSEKEELSTPQRDFVSGPMYVAALREGQAAPNLNLVALLTEEAASVEKLIESGEGFSLDNEDHAISFNRFESALSSNRRRPGLKELSILFLDID